MPLPLIPVVLFLGGLGASGVGAGTKGGIDMHQARKSVRGARAEYDAAHERHAEALRFADAVVASYGDRQTEVQATTLADFAAWLTANEKKVKLLLHERMEAVATTPIDLSQIGPLVHQPGVLSGGLRSVFLGAAARQAALMGVQQFAVAGTGTAISSLSGAAASNATLAWLGGGTLAAGGGGVAAGGIVATGIGIAPGMFLGGISIAIEGSKAKTKAAAYGAEVEVKVAEIDVQIELFDELVNRCKELWEVLDRLEERARSALEELSAQEFDVERDLELFQRTALLMSSLRKVLGARLINADGNVGSESFEFLGGAAEWPEGK